MKSHTSNPIIITPEESKFVLSPEDEFDEKSNNNKENVSPFEEKTPLKPNSQEISNLERAPLSDISDFFLHD